MTSVPSDLATEASFTESVRLSESRVREQDGTSGSYVITNSSDIQEYMLSLFGPAPLYWPMITESVTTNMHMCALCSIMKSNLFDSFRCEGNVSRSDSDCAETRNQSGHPILRDELAAQLVQR